MVLRNRERMDADQLADRVAHAMLAAEGTGPAWGIVIEEARAGFARLRMTVGPAPSDRRRACAQTSARSRPTARP